MKLVEQKIIDFIQNVDSDSPAPGGGSVSALISSLGASLARMVGHLTVTKKEIYETGCIYKNDFEHALSHLEVIKDELIILIDKDTLAFNEIMNAYKLSKDEPDIRSKAIEDATLHAIEIPYRVSLISLKALELLPTILSIGNKQAISDLGVAVLSLSSGIEGALYNVSINLPGISNQETKVFYEKEYHQILTQTHLLKENLLTHIYRELGI